MKRIVWKFGLLSGAILAVITSIELPLCMNGTLDFDNSEIFGYTAMFLAFLMVFFGIRSYRDRVNAGAITFGKAFQVGILITLITTAVYVISWEIVYFNFIPNFAETYSAHVIKKAQASGASAESLEATKRQMAEFSQNYRKPLYNIGMTFLEIFPLGLVVTAVSAAILRKKPAGPGAQTVSATVITSS